MKQPYQYDTNILSTSDSYKKYVSLSMICSAIILLTINDVFSQRPWYSPPLDFGIVPAGTFGEPRSGHFHSGIDIKTNGEAGYPVYCADDGYISRIKVSSSGFGKVLYLSHPGEVTTVYAHLRAFSPDMNKLIDSIQFQKQQYEIEVFPEMEQYPVSKGELIGYTGNTGSSGGPHLHYEFRHSRSQKPYDPLIAGITYSDTVAPVITNLILYTPGEFGGYYGAERFVYPLSDQKDTVTLTSPDLEFFIGFTFFETSSNNSNRLGIQQYSLLEAGQEIFSFMLDSFLFSDSKYVNAITDPLIEKTTGTNTYLCIRQPANYMTSVSGSGFVKLTTGSKKLFELRLQDNSGNQTSKYFYVAHSIADQPPGICNESGGIKVEHKRQFRIKNPSYSFKLDEGSLYDDIRLLFIKTTTVDSEFKNRLEIGDDAILIHKSFSLTLRSEKVTHQTGLLRVNENDTTWLGGSHNGDQVTAYSSKFGVFFLKNDTIAPTVLSAPVLQTDTILNRQYFSVNVNDNLSGINEVDCSWNQKWVVTERNSNTSAIKIYLAESQSESSGELIIKLKDEAGNSSIFTYQLTIDPKQINK